MLGLLAAISIALTLGSLSASASSSYCGGQKLNGFEACFGAARDLSEVTAFGEQHSVCVSIGAEQGGCSGGPNQIAKFNKGKVVHQEPGVENNAAGTNVVFGTAF
ncbi:MAG: hypothetical protein ACHQHO_12895 [Solirubrobacterales bacterium]